jgi:hypothetical protein
VPGKAVVGTTTDPETWPVLADMKQPGVAAGNGGTMVAVQVVARELKPEPVNVKTVLTVPDVGVTMMSAVTLKAANGV